MSGFFAIRDLPQPSARVTTDENDEISFSFEGVTCTVDNADGSFTIRVDTSTRIYPHVTRILLTGYIDKYGRYTYSKKSRWATERLHYARESDGDVRYYADPRYFEDNITRQLRQHKVYIRV